MVRLDTIGNEELEIVSFLNLLVYFNIIYIPTRHGTFW